MATRTYEFGLKGLPVPDGEIDARDLVAILEPLRLAAIRVARQVGGSARTGRTPKTLDAAGNLRFKATHPGSTVLEVALGDPRTLAGMPDEELIGERFEELVAGVAANKSPAWTTAPIAAACRRLSLALRACGAEEFSFARSDDGKRVLARAQTAALDDEPWRVAPEVAGEATVSGHLDLVDLRRSYFRVRDDAGNDIGLVDVRDAVAASQLVGKRVIASGLSETDGTGRLRLVEPEIRPDAVPAAWTTPPEAFGPVQRVTADQLPHIDVSDEEIEEFLKEIRS
jgi:hypothetical protein